MVEVKLEIGNGSLRSVAQILRQTNKRLDRLAEKGINNNGNISDKDLTNLQRDIVSYGQQIIAKKVQTQAALEQAQLQGNVAFAQQLIKVMKKLVESEKQVGQLFSSSAYQQIDNFKVNKSSAFKSNADLSFFNQFDEKITDLAKEINRFRRSASTLNQRWNKSVGTGVMTYERYQQYAQRAKELGDNDYTSQVDDLQKEYQDRLANLRQERAQINREIKAGNASGEMINRRSGIDEEIALTESKNKKLQAMSESVSRANQAVQDATSGINEASKDKRIKILAPENSIRGQFRKHSSRIIRGSLIAGLGSMTAGWRRGNSSILASFDNLKSATYQFGGNDKYVQDQMFGNNVGLNLTQASRYLNAFTSGQGTHSLSGNKARDLVNAWGGLATYNGATDTTTQNLEHTASDVATHGLSASQSERLANAIQQALTNSHMSAKANEQEQALSAMYQNAAQITGSVSASGLTNIAGFQALMAQGGSSMQGQAGAQAYSGLTNTLSNISDPTAWLLWGGGYANTFSMNDRAALMKKMQEAPEKPWLYSTPIKNMLQAQSYTTKDPKTQRRNVAMNLVEMSNGSLTMNQAEHLVKLEQEGKLTKKQIQKETKGKSKGGKKNYDKSGTKSIRDEQKAVNQSEVKAARMLNHLTRHLTGFFQKVWISSFLTGMASGASGQVFSSIFTGLLKGKGHGASKLLAGGAGKVARGILKHGGKGALVTGGIIGGVTLAEHFNSRDTESNKDTDNKKIDPYGTAPLKGSGYKPHKLTKKQREQALKVSMQTGHAPRELGLNSSSSHKGSSKGRRGSNLGGKLNRASDLSKPQPLYKGRPKLNHLSLKEPKLTKEQLDRATKAGPPALNTNNDKKKLSGKNTGRLLYGDKDSKKHESVRQLEKKGKSKHKFLVKREWNLIDYLNTFWDVFLRKVKESSDGGDSDDSDSGGEASDPDGTMSKKDFEKAARKAAKLMHVKLSQNDIDRLYHQAFTESHVNPAQGGGIDDHDGTGLPYGLFQFKKSTWAAAQRHMPKGHNNMFSAVDQIMAVLADSTWRSDLEGLNEARGWTPHGYALGGINTTARIVQFNQKLAHSNISSTTANDMRSIFERSLIHNQNNYIKGVKRSAPRFKVTINVDQAQQFDKDDIINKIINSEFNNWLDQKQQVKLINYYNNETSGLFV